MSGHEAASKSNSPSESQPARPLPLEPAGRRRSLRNLGLILVATAVLLFGAHRYASRQPLPASAGTPLAGDGEGQLVPDFVLKDIHGNKFRMADLKGKVVILDFWATWCQPCKIEIPWFVDLYDRYRAKGLEIVGVSMDEAGPEVVQRFAKHYEMNYRVLLGNEEVAELFGGIYGLPTTFIIDREGRIRDKHMGLVSRSVFEEAVKELL